MNVVLSARLRNKLPCLVPMRMSPRRRQNVVKVGRKLIHGGVGNVEALCEDGGLYEMIGVSYGCGMKGI